MTAPEHYNVVEKLEQFGDLQLTLRAELDQTTLTYGELAELSVGSLIRLHRSIGENIAVYAENVLLGFGEVLLMDGLLTVRLTELKNSDPLGAASEQNLDSKNLEITEVV